VSAATPTSECRRHARSTSLRAGSAAMANKNPAGRFRRGFKLIKLNDLPSLCYWCFKTSVAGLPPETMQTISVRFVQRRDPRRTLNGHAAPGSESHPLWPSRSIDQSQPPHGRSLRSCFGHEPCNRVIPEHRPQISDPIHPRKWSTRIVTLSLLPHSSDRSNLFRMFSSLRRGNWPSFSGSDPGEL